MKEKKRVAKGLQILSILIVFIVLVLFSPSLVKEIGTRMEQMKTEYEVLLNHPNLTVLENTAIRIKAKVVIGEENRWFPLNIPYSKRWKVQIDGKNEAIIKNEEAMMALNADKGAHIIEVQYQLKEAMAFLGIVAIIVILLVCLFAKKSKKVLPEEVEEMEEVKEKEVLKETEAEKVADDDALWEFRA